MLCGAVREGAAGHCGEIPRLVPPGSTSLGMTRYCSRERNVAGIIRAVRDMDRCRWAPSSRFRHPCQEFWSPLTRCSSTPDGRHGPFRRLPVLAEAELTVAHTDSSGSTDPARFSPVWRRVAHLDSPGSADPAPFCPVWLRVAHFSPLPRPGLAGAHASCRPPPPHREATLSCEDLCRLDREGQPVTPRGRGRPGSSCGRPGPLRVLYHTLRICQALY